MGVLDAVVSEASAQYAVSNAKITSLVSGLLAYINETPGGLSALLESLNRAGLGQFVASWLDGRAPRSISSTSLEAAIGREPLEKIADRAGVPFPKAASIMAFLLPKMVNRLAPGGIIPTRLPSDVLAYAGSATGAVAAGTRQAARSAKSVVKKSATPSWLVPTLVLLAFLLLGFWLWASRHPHKDAGPDSTQGASSSPNDARNWSASA